VSLARSQIHILERSAQALEAREVKPYFELKSLLSRTSLPDQQRFEKDYCRFYGLNIAGLTDQFLRVYFDALYSAKPTSTGWPDYLALLRKLHVIPNRKGKESLQSSFVSKLVASKDEAWPLYDRHVANFFGLFVPRSGSLAFRAYVLVAHLEVIKQRYLAWAEDELAPALARLRRRIPELAGCHDIRVCDFLVWRAGNKKLAEGIE
jgi:hypothetical protein